MATDLEQAMPKCWYLILCSDLVANAHGAITNDQTKCKNATRGLRALRSDVSPAKMRTDLQQIAQLIQDSTDEAKYDVAYASGGGNEPGSSYED